MGLGTDILQDPSKGIHFQKRKTLPFSKRPVNPA